MDTQKTLITSKSFAKHLDAVSAVSFLKKEYNVTHGFAHTIVLLSKKDNDTPDDLVENQYKGKEALIPIYDGLIAIVKDFGKDITITPKKASVSLIRKRQFTLIKPATKSRIDLGLKFNEKPTTDRLLKSGPFDTMCTHRAQLSNSSELDTELRAFLKEDYEQAK